jgi:MSHA biogenesis protein MshK
MTIGWYKLVTAASRWAVSALCILSAALCHAEDLPDPTRPPASILWGGGAGTAGQGGEAESGAVTRQTGLQSTIISRTRRAAIIDGKTVELGEKHGDARLIQVNEGSVVLQSGKKLQVLKLFPDVRKSPSENKSSIKLPESGVQPDEVSTVPGAPEEEK